MCPKSSRNLSECVKASIESLRPSIKSGDFGNGFKLEGIDPIRMDDIIIKRSSYSSNVTNSVASGTGDFVIEKIKVDFNNAYFDILIRIPKIFVTGNFDDKFNFGWLNSRASGKLTTWLANLKVRIIFKGHHETKNGQKYIKVNSIIVTPKVSQIKIRMENAFADKTLNEAINSFLNQNVDLFLPEVETSIKSTISESILKYFFILFFNKNHLSARMVRNTISRVFDNFPLSVLNP